MEEYHWNNRQIAASRTQVYSTFFQVFFGVRIEISSIRLLRSIQTARAAPKGLFRPPPAITPRPSPP